MKSDLKAYYTELGVQPDASADEIREAYRRLAKKYHPDTNRGDHVAEERFKRISEAYRVLSNPANRLEYHTKEEIRTRARSNAKGKSTASFKDVFKQVFRAGFGGETPDRAVRTPKRGKDHRLSLDVNPIELATGVRRTIKMTRAIRCEVCGGGGVKPGYDAGQCTVCHGLGEIPSAKNGKTVFAPCSNCEGTGRVAKEPCMHCAGTSLNRASARVEIIVPKRSKAGQTLTLKGEGSEGAFGGPSGDLHVTLNVIPQDDFDLDGSNLIYQLSINLKQALLGDVVSVPLPTGIVRVTLPAGLPEGKMLRVKGKGIANDSGEVGDLLVRINLVFPEQLGKRSKELLDDLMEQPEWKKS
ncbi:J domain-containing protein [bacterium]|nr:J domain-containing protein [bacterium]